MNIEIIVPSPGESISEVEIASWFVKSGDMVKKDQEVGEIESEKATLPLIAADDGKITILKEAGETVPVGEIVGTIDNSVKNTKSKEESPSKENLSSATTPQETTIDSENQTSKQSKITERKDKEKDNASGKPENIPEPGDKQQTVANDNLSRTTPLARKMMEDNGLSIDDVLNGLRKIGKKEVELVLSSSNIPDIGKKQEHKAGNRDEEHIPMSKLRKKLSERLVAVRNETAMLTTFNEADMSSIISLRKTYQALFTEHHGIKLGYMSFFTKAASLALKEFPNLNSRIENDEIIHALYTDIGIAVQTEKGLMVPVLRNVENMSLADIEKGIMELASIARKNRISIDQMSGGTFTITNGGIFGSLLSTPIINPPQSAILGMHNIVERPVAINGKVEIRPMMYLAISYDHRLVDGRDSVSFLVKIKEYLENPETMLTGNIDLKKRLLGLE